MKEIKFEKIMFLETNSESYAYFQNMYSTLSRFCKKMIHFNRRDYYFKFGKRKMNKMFLDLVEKEKPEYIFTWLTWDEFYPETLLKIKKISPNTKTVAIFGDDVHQFDDFSRYYALLFDYSFTTLKSFLQRYNQDGIDNVFFTSLTDNKNFHPVKTEKIYDVTFIGTQKEDKSGRYELVKYLKDKGIKLKLFGFGWEKYPEFKEIYGGTLGSDEMVKVINQSKINLCFSKNNFGQEQMKAKIFEVGACKSFTVCEYAKDYEDYFSKDKDIVFFKDQKEMIQKINYFLSHEKERETIAQNAFHKITSEFGLYHELRNFFQKTISDKEHKKLPVINESVFVINNENISQSASKIKKMVEKFSYVGFNEGNVQYLPFKNFFQIYSLEKTRKEISCCNYYINSTSLGDYLLFFSRDGLNLLDKPSFDSFLNINQLLVKKKYFLDNLKKFKQIYSGKGINFVDKNNTSFVAIPLVRLRNYNLHQDYEKIKKCFGFKFIYTLYSEIYQKKLSIFPFALFVKGINQNFIFRSIKEYVKDKDIIQKFKKLN